MKLFFESILLFISIGIPLLPSLEASPPEYSTSPLAFAELVARESNFVVNLYSLCKSVEEKKSCWDETESRYISDFEETILHGTGLVMGEFVKFMESGLLNTQKLGEDASKNVLKIYRTIDRLHRLINSTTLPRRLIPAFPIPTEADVEKAAMSILRLKQIYKIPFANFTEGRLFQLPQTVGLGTRHIFHICKVAQMEKLHPQTVDCLDLLVNKTLGSEEQVVVSYEEALDMLRVSIKEHDEKFDAIIGPDDVHLEIPLFNDALDNETSSNFLNRVPMFLETMLPPQPYTLADMVEVEMEHMPNLLQAEMRFSQLCRGEQLPPLKDGKRGTVCYLEKAKHPALTLKPAKVEVLLESPLVIQIHDFLSVNEVEIYRTKARSNGLRGSMVLFTSNTTLGKKAPVASKIRTSTSSWISERGHSTFRNVLARIGHITGMEVAAENSSESMHIVVYNPGGHYASHLDSVFSGGSNESFVELGDRIATFMIYLSNVEMGGATAFPLLGLSVPPNQGSAVLWFNLHPDGSRDDRMLHGGCSVIHGAKWSKTPMNESLNASSCGNVNSRKQMDSIGSPVHEAKVPIIRRRLMGAMIKERCGQEGCFIFSDRIELN